MNDKVQHLRSFSELGTFIRIKPLSRSAEREKGNTNYIHYGDIHGKFKGFINETTSLPYIEDVSNFNDFLLDGDIVFADASEDSADLGKTVLIENVNGRNVISGLHTHAFRPNSTLVNSLYLKYFTESPTYVKEMCRLGQGISVLAISKKEINKLQIYLPDLCRQSQMANFVRNVDRKILLIEDKISTLKVFKNGLIQNNIINNEFEYNCKLDKVLKERKVYSLNDGIYIHCSLGKDGVNEKRKNENRDFLVKNMNKKYKITKLNDICYNPANLKFGVICKNTFGEGIFSPIYVTFEVNMKFNVDFIELLLTNESIIKKMRKYEEGTVYERMAVKPADLLKTNINYPSLEIQQELAREINIVERKIELCNLKLENFKLFKKGLLQQMFI